VTTDRLQGRACGAPAVRPAAGPAARGREGTRGACWPGRDDRQSQGGDGRGRALLRGGFWPRPAVR